MSRDELDCELKRIKFMLTCKQASQLISQSLDRPLSLTDRIKLRFHLFICDACTAFKKQLDQLRAAILRLRSTTEDDNSIQLPLDAKARIANRVSANIESSQH